MEKAEFYHFCGLSYYKIDQYTIATRYLEMAVNIFEKDENHLERLINCYIALGGIAVELDINGDGESYYKRALSESKKFPETHALAYRALGLLSMRKNELQKAQNYFVSALAIKEHRESVFGIKTKTNLASVLYRISDKEAYNMSHTALQEARRFGQVEYLARLKIIFSIYEEFSEKELDNQLDKLVKLNCSASLVAEEISMIFKERNEFELALKYMTFAFKARINPQILGGNQE